MKVVVAKTAGFCFGVKRAVDKVYEQIDRQDGPIYTFGPIIHNETVVRDLEERGVRVIESEEDLRSLEKGTVIIRSHGACRRICEEIEQKGLKLVDATCPFVKKIRRWRGSGDGVRAALWCWRTEKRPKICGWNRGKGPVWFRRRHLTTKNFKI